MPHSSLHIPLLLASEGKADLSYLDKTEQREKKIPRKQLCPRELTRYELSCCTGQKEKLLEAGVHMVMY